MANSMPFFFSSPIPQIQNNANAIGLKASAHNHFQGTSTGNNHIYFWRSMDVLKLLLIHSVNYLCAILGYLGLGYSLTSAALKGIGISSGKCLDFLLTISSYWFGKPFLRFYLLLKFFDLTFRKITCRYIKGRHGKFRPTCINRAWNVTKGRREVHLCRKTVLRSKSDGKVGFF